MNELPETTAVSWDYITRHVSGMQNTLVKRQSLRSLSLFLKKFPSLGCFVSIPTGCSNHMFTEQNWETTFIFTVAGKKQNPGRQFGQEKEISCQWKYCPRRLFPFCLSCHRMSAAGYKLWTKELIWRNIDPVILHRFITTLREMNLVKLELLKYNRESFRDKPQGEWKRRLRVGAREIKSL